MGGLIFEGSVVHTMKQPSNRCMFVMRQKNVYMYSSAYHNGTIYDNST
uniref:Uncharacterized protein n=1 Tax=Lepeophtheirus salmonis TaxID=72036 RepID=A0A0K2TF95_LEPSM